MEEEAIIVWNFAKETPEDDAIRASFAHQTTSGGGASDPTAIGFHGHQLQFVDLVEAIEHGRSPLVDGLEARKSVEIIQAIYQSSRSQQPVSLPLLSEGGHL